MVFKGYIFSIIYVFLCILISLIMHKFGIDRKITRKVVHILVGFEWIILYHFMGAGSIHFLIVCLIFLALLLLEYKLKLVPAISSSDDNAPGTVYYALAMSVMAGATMLAPQLLIYPFGIAVFCTSIGDGFAGLIGQGIKKYNPKIWNSKTLLGTLANFISSLAVVAVFSETFSLKISLAWTVIIALFSAVLEMVSEKGLDNLWITIGVSILTLSVMQMPFSAPYILPVLITPILLSVVIGKRVLTPLGAICALVLDVVASIAFGNCGFLILFTFLFFSIVADKIKNSAKKHGQNDNCDKTRGAAQVLANGLASLVCAAIYIATRNRVFLIAFTAAMAEALADTASSGIGALSSRTYDVFKLKKCESGISGGMSVLGTASALVASAAVALVPLLFGYVGISDFIIISIIGFAGSVFDSLLGSLAQAKYKCRVCGRVVESETHCSKRTDKHSGITFVTNSAVNFLSTLFSAILTFIIYTLPSI